MTKVKCYVSVQVTYLLDKFFFHLFPKILTIVVSTSTWSQNEGKHLYFVGMKEFLPESDFVYGLRTVLCDASSEF